MAKAITAASPFIPQNKFEIRNSRSKESISNYEYMKNSTDLICALSTAVGRSGIAVIRLSGNHCQDIVRKIFIPKKRCQDLEPRLSIVGKIFDLNNGNELDEAVVTCFHEPHSYTGEDMAEFSIHGNPVIIAALLDSLCSLGARLAEPGEFTMRAFLNQKLDLTQAEAVNDIIMAKTLFQAQIAGRQRSGSLAQQLRSTKDELLDIIVNLESAIEFAEENLQTDSRKDIERKIEEIGSNLQKWIESYRKGRIIHDGIRMAVIGRPNVGKSSLFNSLLAQNRSIVTDIPGTTRDTVSETMSIEGIPIHLLDTAGIHQTENIIEQIGIERSQQAISDTDVILFVVDAGREASKQDFDLKNQMANSNCIVVFNKCDLSCIWSAEDKKKISGDWKYHEVSSKTGMGIEELRSIIIGTILGTSRLSQDGIMITNMRHCHALEHAEMHLQKAANTFKNLLSEEFALLDLQKCLEYLGEITGETYIEDLLDEIFSKFCIGK
jgi:tRNA modification GTPase